MGKNNNNNRRIIMKYLMSIKKINKTFELKIKINLQQKSQRVKEILLKN